MNMSVSSLSTHGLRPEQLERSVAYVAENLSRFVKLNEHVLICFGRGEGQVLGSIFEQAVLRVGGIPLFWSSDQLWKSLLRQAFLSRSSVIIGPPLVVLGLAKLVKATGTPLNIRHVVTAGYPCLDWVIEGIIKGLDCSTWGCFGSETGAFVGGFSCGHSRGVHLRSDAYGLEIVDENDQIITDGRSGRIRVRDLSEPDQVWQFPDQGRVELGACQCGSNIPRLVDILPHSRFPEDVQELGQTLHSWTSILDCRVTKGPYGLEMELVVFPGEKLPKLPTCAKRIIRPWDPDRDVPFSLENPVDLSESH